MLLSNCYKPKKIEFLTQILFLNSKYDQSFNSISKIDILVFKSNPKNKNFLFFLQKIKIFIINFVLFNGIFTLFKYLR
jgi:hypothetical protein